MWMTVGNLAEFFGKSDDTVIAHAKKCGCKFEHGVTTLFDKEAVQKISQSLYKRVPMAVKEAIDRLGETPAKPVSTLAENSGVDSRLDRLESLVEKMLSVIIETKTVQPLKQESLPAPVVDPIEPRDKIREIIEKYAKETNIEYHYAWVMFYDKVYYATHVNVKKRREGTNKSGLDVLEELGLIDKGLAVARTYFQ